MCEKKINEVGKEAIQGLFKKLSDGTLSDAERRQLQEWYQEHGSEGIQQMMDTDWENTVAETQLSEQMSWAQFKTKLHPKRITPVRTIRRWAAVAASILLVAIASTIYFQYQAATPAVIAIANTTTEEKNVRLPDGSSVWLNTNSSISYLKTFGKTVREVKLEGEAFFEVAKDSTRPFTVYAEGFSTTALGTSFNIRAFADSSDVKVALVTGKVAVSPLRDGKPQTQYQRILTPGKQLRYKPTARTISIEDFDPTLTLAWREGNLVFDNESLATALLRLEKHYQVDIQFEAQKLRNCFINTSFDKKESLKNILTILKFSDHLEFTQRGNRYIVLAGTGCE